MFGRPGRCYCRPSCPAFCRSPTQDRPAIRWSTTMGALKWTMRRIPGSRHVTGHVSVARLRGTGLTEQGASKPADPVLGAISFLGVSPGNFLKKKLNLHEGNHVRFTWGLAMYSCFLWRKSTQEGPYGPFLPAIAPRPFLVWLGMPS